MKKKFLFFAMLLGSLSVFAQPDLDKYPEPEFSKEVYYLEKGKVNKLVRLEKESSKMKAKTKLGGFGGFENGYAIDGEKSTTRLNSGSQLSFVFSTGAGVKNRSSMSDSIMAANGMDTDMMTGMMNGMNDPTTNIILYKAESGKGMRKILMQKMGGALPFASKKIKSSDKYTFSIKKIREGYTEFVIDKTLPAGEYAFSVPEAGMGGAGGDVLLFAFAIN